jgi:predicted nucleic acid-binding protein
MSNYLLDTNILLLLLRQDSRWETLETRFDLPHHRSFISVVTLGELQALGLRNSWGIRRMAQIDQLKHSFVVLRTFHENSII